MKFSLLFFPILLVKLTYALIFMFQLNHIFCHRTRVSVSHFFFCLNRIDFTYWMGICEGGKERKIKIIYSIRIESSIFDFSRDMFCVYDSGLVWRRSGTREGPLRVPKNLKNSFLTPKIFRKFLSGLKVNFFASSAPCSQPSLIKWNMLMFTYFFTRDEFSSFFPFSRIIFFNLKKREEKSFMQIIFHITRKKRSGKNFAFTASSIVCCVITSSRKNL